MKPGFAFRSSAVVNENRIGKKEAFRVSRRSV